jgi:SAM-dependent methyltransferase
MTTREFHSDGIRHQFSGIENLTYNYSQADQDIFVLSMLDGRRNGTYLEIGCNDGFVYNNTALLETVFGWTGVSIDSHKPWIDAWSRHNPVEHACGLEIDYLDLLHRHGMNQSTIDYLSLDCDPPEQTLKILKRLPFDQIQFAVITFEHDCHAHGPEVKHASRDYLNSHGYQLVVSNISENGLATDFEDWWVHPDLVDHELISSHTDLRDTIKDYRWYLYNRLPDCLKSTSWVEEFYQNPIK